MEEKTNKLINLTHQPLLFKKWRFWCGLHLSSKKDTLMQGLYYYNCFLRKEVEK
jgi:hypothetical protein